jgi:hypothetical protein
MSSSFLVVGGEPRSRRSVGFDVRLSDFVTVVLHSAFGQNAPHVEFAFNISGCHQVHQQQADCHHLHAFAQSTADFARNAWTVD